MFIKFPEIENSYQLRHIDFFLEKFPDLENTEFIIESKLDGANLSMIFSPKGEIKYYSRNQIVDTTFYGLTEAIKIYKNEIAIFQKISKDFNQNIQFYFEYFGKGIQNRINYGDSKQLRIIGLRINDFIQPPQYILHLLEEYNILYMYAPIIKIVNSLTEALEINCEFVNKINSDSGDLEEGIVIKPFKKIVQSGNGEIFILKKKNPKFAEKMSKKNKETKKISDECSAIIENFIDYITESRMFSVFSKEGPILEKSQIGKYVKFIFEDALKDYLKENDSIDDEYMKNVSSTASKLIANMLLKQF